MNMNAFVETNIACINNADTQDKLRSLKWMLDYDKEMFMTIFNTKMEHEKTHDDIYITDIYEGMYFYDIEWQQGVLSQLNAQDKENAVLGHGMLYTTTDNSMYAELFCDDTWGWAESLVACKSMGYDYGIYLHGVSETLPDDVAS